ncbi:hypothetical protein DPMN_042483 [Dreissena polymorpha]|uniref:Uncharacterized protein n=1 Tax=Dreissena polymorpha TaxID=45954 RepID=A0A9D4HX01_DREPO|nr:hypothetical protein DPMN_042483 [Dreissena polymorpha]
MLVEHEDEGGGCLCGLRMRMRLGFMIEGVWLSMMLGYVGSGLCVYHEGWNMKMVYGHDEGMANEGGECGLNMRGSVRRLGMWGEHEGIWVEHWAEHESGWKNDGGMWVEHDGGVCGWCMRCMWV